MVKKSSNNKSKPKVVTNKVKSAQKSAAAANLLRKRKRSVSPVAVSSKKVKSAQAVKKAKHVSRSVTPDRTEKGKKSKKIEKTKNVKKAEKNEKGKGNKKSQLADKKVKNGKSNKQAEKVHEKVKTPKPVAIKKKKTDSEKIDLPADLSAVVVQTLLSVNHRVSADKIVELIKEDYKNVSEVLVHSAVGDLFRQGKLTEAKSLFALDEDVLVQLNPPKAPEVVAEPEPAQEDAVEIEVEAPAPVAADAEPTQENAVDAEQPATTETLSTSAKKSAAKSVTKSVSKSVTKQSVGKESVPKTNLSQLAQEEFADKVISSQEAEALQVLNDN